MTDAEATQAKEEFIADKKQESLNPLLTRRFINAHARLSGCMESDPAAQCEHRHYSRRTLEELVGLVVRETP